MNFSRNRLNFISNAFFWKLSTLSTYRISRRCLIHQRGFCTISSSSPSSVRIQHLHLDGKARLSCFMKKRNLIHKALRSSKWIHSLHSNDFYFGELRSFRKKGNERHRMKMELMKRKLSVFAFNLLCYFIL